MLLRFRGPDGTQRITVEPEDTFGTLGEKVSKAYEYSSDREGGANIVQLLESLPPNIDLSTLTLSNSPSGGDTKYLNEIASFKVSQIGLR
jgi:nuclear protein localization family protein 4